MTSVETSILENALTSKNRSLYSVSKEQPVILIFLRHFGCVFCREAIRDIAHHLPSFSENKVTPILVHMADFQTAEEYFDQYELVGIEHISDPECELYGKFGLLKGSFTQLYGLQVWIRGIQTSVKEASRMSLKQIGDGLQMPGIFFLENGEIKEEFIHSKISDRPNYIDLINCCPDKQEAL